MARQAATGLEAAYRHTSWSARDGLPQNSVNDLLQTRDGFLWGATFGGLVRFDGRTFRTYGQHPEHGPASNRVLALYQARDGALWIGHERGEVDRYADGRFTTFREGLPNSPVWAFAEDDRGRLYVASEAGVSWFDGRRFRPVEPAPAGPSGAIRSMVGTPDGAVWFASLNRLYRLRGDSLTTISSAAGAPFDRLEALDVDSDGALWLADTGRILRYASGQFKAWPVNEGRRVAALIVGPDGTRWAGFHQEDGTWRLARITLSEGRPPRVEESAAFAGTIRVIRTDREGNLWVGFDSEGLHRFTPYPIVLYRLPTPTSSPIIAVASDGGDGLWVASQCGRLYHFREGQFTASTRDRNGDPWQCFGALLRDRKGDLWVAQQERLVHRTPSADITFTPDDGLPDTRLDALFEDPEGRLWVGSRGEGVAVIEGDRVRQRYRQADGLLDDDVYFITRTRDGALWFGNRTGATRLADGRFTTLTSDQGLAPGIVRAVFEDPDGGLWFGTYGGGLSGLVDGQLVRLTMAEGLAEDVVSRITGDGRGNLWMLGNMGLSIVSLEELRAFATGSTDRVHAILLGVEEGMAEGNGAGPVARTPDGRTWFPTIDGLAGINLDTFAFNQVPPPVYIEDVHVGATPVPIDQPIRLGPGHHDLRIAYVGLSFSAPEKVNYEYRLIGYDAGWVQAGSRTEAIYTNLPPGDYTFEVRAANVHWIWSAVPARRAVRVEAAFYETVWFILGLALALILSGYGIYAFRNRRISHRNAELEALNRRLNREVEERLNAENELERSLSMLASTLEATAEGILVVNLDRTVEAYNEKFVQLWHLEGAPALKARDARRLFTDKQVALLEEEDFAVEKEFLYENPEQDGSGVLHFADGTVLEWHSTPQRIAGHVVGRVWSFRDITRREQALSALRTSEERFSRAFRSSPDAITISRLRDGLFLDVNEGFETHTGYTREEAVGRTAHDLGLWKPNDREAMVDVLKRTGRVRNMSFPFRMKNGEWRDFVVSAEIVELDGEACLVAVSRDVTEQKRAEEALRASEEKFARAFQASPDAIMLTNIQDGRIIEVNEGFFRATGYTAEEAVGRTTMDLNLWVQPGDRDRIMERLIAGEEYRNVELDVRIKSGEIRHCLASMERIRVGEEELLVSITRDITERKLHEEAIRASEEKFAKAFQASPDAILITTIPDGVILDVNEGFLRTTGFTAEEAVGHSWSELALVVSPGQQKRFAEQLEARGQVVDLPMELRLRNGRHRHFLVSAGVIQIGGRPCLLTVARDVTEQRKAEAERERLIAELEARNAELERFTYTVSHDLKAPLVTIKGFVGMLQLDLASGDAERVAADLDRITSAADKMARLLNELLELSRVGRLMNPPEDVPLADLAREAADLVHEGLSAAGARLEIAPEMPTVRGDRVRLLEVFQNLIDNAVRFRGEADPPCIEVGAEVGEDAVRCFVRDNGLGIDPAYREKIFGLFERLETGIEGTGIGLALVRRIVEVHGGRIWVESEGRGKGSTFFFTLPKDGQTPPA